MAKSPSKDKIEKSLGIGDSFKTLDVGTNPEDEEKRLRAEKREISVSEFKERWEKYRNGDTDNEKFVKDALKELAEMGMETIRVMKDETAMTGDYKAADAVATVTNAVISALNSINGVDVEKKKLEQKQQEIDNRAKSAADTKNITNNTVFVGSVNDILKKARGAVIDVKKEE